MKKESPGLVDARHRGKIEADTHNLVPHHPKFNTSGPAKDARA